MTTGIKTGLEGLPGYTGEAPPPVVLPRPANGLFYRLQEVAEIMGVTIWAVGKWRTAGRKGFILRSQDTPRGITPQDLCEFMSKVNGRVYVIENET